MNPAEEYILGKPEPFKSILLHLQVIIEATIPELELKYKWKVPYYYLDGNPFCYLNVSKGYVDLGFWASAHLKGYDKFLVTEKRKVVKSLRYYFPNEINQEILIDILKELKKINHKGFWKR
ncbi:DUF1801 domain-containing protein [Pseudotenacibaculum haliotis]|uniref:DUF1801 domain-containing protein n=1 Tax=Pseudotenacibaculum haliotis TaxID=1862138 RepID=A0ABW5LRB1_9FLAO